MRKSTLKIGVSARFFHPEPSSIGVQSKTLQYLEQSMAHWVMSRDVLVFMIPSVDKDGLIHRSNIRLSDYAKHLDGLRFHVRLWRDHRGPLPVGLELIA